MPIADEVVPLQPAEAALLQDAIAALGNLTGMRAELVAEQPPQGKRARADAIITVGHPGRQTRYLVEIKQNVDRATTLAQVREVLKEFEQPGLLATRYMTAELAQRCRDIGLPFIDTAGNAYLPADAAFIFVTGQKRPQHTKAPGTRGGGTTAALRVIFALLNHPKLLLAPYRQIAHATGVALGTVGWVLFDLQERGFIARKTDEPQILEPARLLDEWVVHYPTKLRPKLNVRTFRAPTANGWNEIALPPGAFWGGEVAADRLTHALKPARATIYMRPDVRRRHLTPLVTRYHLRADPRGDIEILDTFWDLPELTAPTDVVPPMLAYADLMATLDPRNLEVARLLRAKFIDDAAPEP